MEIRPTYTNFKYINQNFNQSDDCYEYLKEAYDIIPGRTIHVDEDYEHLKPWRISS